MRGVSYWFFLSASLYGLAGMVFGIAMAASHDHSLGSAHAHLNLVGWVSMGLFAFFYQSVPALAATRLAKVHFALASAGVWLMVPGIALATLGKGEGLAVAGSLLTATSMLIFTGMVLRSGLGQRS